MLKTLSFLAAVALAGCGGGSEPPADPIGYIGTPAINDGAAFAIPAGQSLRHALQALEYVNASPEPVDLVLTLHATEMLAGGVNGAAVALSLAAGGFTSTGPTHIANSGQRGEWSECVEVRATAGPGSVFSATAAAVLAGAGTLDSRGVVIEGVIYPHGRAPLNPAC